MFMVEKLCVFKVRHVYLFTSSSLSSMLCSTLLIVRYDSTAQRPTGNEREQSRRRGRKDILPRGQSIKYHGEEFSDGEKVVQSISLSNRETDESRTSKKTIKSSQSEEKKRVYFQS